MTVLTYEQIAEAEYHRHPALSVSTAKRMLEPGGPAKVKWDLDHGREDRREFDLGHAAHKLALGVGEPIVDVGPDLRTKASREAEAMARAAGAIPLRSADAQVALAMAEQLKQHPLVADLLDTGQPELSLFGKHQRTGLDLRGRIDYRRNDGLLVDYKTTNAADTREFTRSVVKYGYHMQAAWYIDIAQQVLGESDNGDRFTFIAQEKRAPYLVHVVELDEDFLRLGRYRNEQAIDLWIECNESGIWPGHPDQLTTLSPPDWAMRELDDHLDPAVEAAFADFLKGFTHD